MTNSETGRSGMDRRTLIKRGAAAGALAWTAPTVLASPAHAADGVFDEFFTNCFPTLSYLLINTGSNCRDYNNSPERIALDLPLMDEACCDKSSYGIAVAQPTCGPTCEAKLVPIIPQGGTLVPISLIEVTAGQGAVITPNPGGNKTCIPLYDPGDCSNGFDVTLTVASGVECEDGTRYEVIDSVKFSAPPASTGSACADRLVGFEQIRQATICVCGPGCPTPSVCPPL